MYRRTDSYIRCLASRVRLKPAGLTLTELIIVIAILSLFLLLAQINLFGVLRKNTFKARVSEFVSAMQMAATAAAESDRRYEVIIDLTEQSFLLRQITSANLAEILDEEIITSGSFGDNCHVAYVEFDDGEFANEGRAKFRAGHAGWQYGGKIVFIDESENPYSVLVNRLNRVIELVRDDVEFLKPKAKEDVVF